MDFQKVKAVVFDLDGTLLDTIRDIGTGVNTALCRYHCPEIPLEKYRDLVGHGSRRLIDLAVPGGEKNEKLDEILQYYVRYYREHCTVHTDYFPGIREMLRSLQAGGYRLAVISNKTERTAQKIIGHYFPEIHFDFVWGNNNVRPLKPAIDAGRAACEELKLKPEEIFYFGDGDTDMEFGSRMGFLTVGCDWGYRSPAQLREAGAQKIVSKPSEVLALLGLN